MRKEILDHLAYALKWDRLKGGTGHRSTREVADRNGLTMKQARGELKRLVKEGLVIEYQDGLWRVLWKLRRLP